MKLKKLEDYVELPVADGTGCYQGLRSLERIDVRPNERRDVLTGVAAYVGKTETVTVFSDFCGSRMIYSKLGKYVELQVRIKNKGDRNIMIYPGEVIGYLTVRKPASKPRTKKATIKTRATWKTN